MTADHAPALWAAPADLSREADPRRSAVDSPVDSPADDGLDYYVILSDPIGQDGVGLLVEAFVLRPDHTVSGIASVSWSRADGWQGASGLSRAVRADRRFLRALVPTGRAGAVSAYRAMGGGELADEPSMRRLLTARWDLPSSDPLRLGDSTIPDGYADRRLYRLLFLGDLSGDAALQLTTRWRLEPPEDAMATVVVGRTTRTVDRHRADWELRRIGPGIGWSVDVTVFLGDAPDTAIGALLQALRQEMRLHGMLPASVERFA